MNGEKNTENSHEERAKALFAFALGDSEKT